MSDHDYLASLNPNDQGDCAICGNSRAAHDRASLPKQADYEYRVRYVQAGGHVHCRVFSRPRGQETYAKCGDLVVGAAEWISFTQTFAAEFLQE